MKYESMMKATTFKERFMPLVKDLNEKHIDAHVTLRGFRQFPFLSWVPYMTGAHPCIGLKVTLKDQDWTIEHVGISHEEPNQSSPRLSRLEFSSGEIHEKSYERKSVSLPFLMDTGQHKYHLSVALRPKSGRVDEMQGLAEEGSCILTTGNVRDRGMVIGSFALAALGSAATIIIERLGPLVQHLVSKLF